MVTRLHLFNKWVKVSLHTDLHGTWYAPCKMEEWYEVTQMKLLWLCPLCDTQLTRGNGLEWQSLTWSSIWGCSFVLCVYCGWYGFRNIIMLKCMRQSQTKTWSCCESGWSKQWSWHQMWMTLRGLHCKACDSLCVSQEMCLQLFFIMLGCTILGQAIQARMGNVSLLA
jgi:hypothetical protein